MHTVASHLLWLAQTPPPQCKNLSNTRPQELVLVRVCVLVLPTIGCCILLLLMPKMVLTLQLTLHGGGYSCHELAIYIPHLCILHILCSSSVCLVSNSTFTNVLTYKLGNIVVCDVMCVSLCMYVCVCVRLCMSACVHECVCVCASAILQNKYFELKKLVGRQCGAPNSNY